MNSIIYCLTTPNWSDIVVAGTLLLLLATSGSGWSATFADAGFTAETVATLEPFSAVGLAFAPDGRIFVWEKAGRVRIIRNGTLLTTPFIDIQARVNRSDDRGLLGLAPGLAARIVAAAGNNLLGQRGRG